MSSSPEPPSMAQLCNTYKEIEQKLTENRAPSMEERRKEIMTLLHEFNDVKDAAQLVIGALANMEDKTIKEIHLCYNLPLSE